MSSSYSYTGSETFTVVHARHIASKVATDLKRIQRFYGQPSDTWIDNYEAELVQLLKHDVIANVVYGFKRSEKWTEASVRYTALPGGTLAADDDPGKIRPNLDVAGARFTSFLSYNARWFQLSPSERDAIRAGCPFARVEGAEPPLEAGYWSDDRSYVAGGRGLGRSTVRR